MNFDRSVFLIPCIYLGKSFFLNTINNDQTTDILLNDTLYYTAPAECTQVYNSTSAATLELLVARPTCRDFAKIITIDLAAGNVKNHPSGFSQQ